MTSPASDIVREEAAACGVSPEAVISRTKTDVLVYVRMQIARRLDEMEYSSPQIGKILHRHHATILFYLGRGKRKPPVLRWKKPPTAKHYLIPYAGAYWPEYEWKERA